MRKTGLTEDGGRRSSARQLAENIWAEHTNAAAGDVAGLPPETELGRRFGVTRHAVRTALKCLADDGRLQRIGRRGPLIPSRPASLSVRGASSIRCINFIQTSNLQKSELRQVAEDYLAGITEALEHREFKTRFTFCEDDCANCESLFWRQAPLREQACVLVNRRMPSLLNWLSERAVPYVVLYYYRYNPEGLPEHHRVMVNKAGGGFKAVQHLLSLGHRRIGYIGDLSGGPYSAPVYEGYEAALRVAALDLPKEDLLTVHTDNPEVAFEPVLDYLRRPSRPTAVLAGNDAAALAALRAARSLGLRVPEDLSVVGFNDGPDAAQSTPPLTTMANPRKALARSAVELLLAVMDGRVTSWQTRVLECELVVRGTTAPLTTGCAR